MKSKSLYLLLVCASLLVFSTCEKDTDVNMESFKIVKEVEKITEGTTTANITGMYEYSGRIDGIKVRVGTSEQLFGSDVFVAEVSGKSYSVNITGLRSGTKYYYRYEVDYGAKDDYLTDISDFTTQSESPTVKTLEVVPEDGKFRVKCKVEADGGSDVTERGICWSKYSHNPDLTDDTLRDNHGGTGQYAIRVENLEMSTTYYVRAYAVNASGTGFGEVLEFSTGGETLKPSVSTVEVIDVTSTSATCTGNVTSDGGLALTGCGVCWSRNHNPTTDGSHADAAEAELGAFQVAMTDLTPNKTYYARAYAINEKGTSYGEELEFHTTEGLPTVTTGSITEVTATSAKGGGEVTDEGATPVTQRGICWSIDHNPTLSDSHEANGTGLGSFTVTMTGLTPNKTYYVRAYATNEYGTAYGTEVEFTAQEGLPTVTTLDVDNITSTTATVHGKVTDQGGSAVTERGVCWGIEPSPTISGNHAANGTGAGEFSVNLTNLTPGKKYYVRAYAINGAKGLAYGEQKEFTTDATLPTVVTGNINGTTVSGNVTDDGGATVTERGICWSTEHDPMVSGNHAASGTGTGDFSVELTGLAPGTTYYVRAYATNSAGTAYGSEKTLTTEANLPTVTTGDVSNIQQTSAQGSGNVTNDGGADVTERGVCWSTSHNPTISDNHANNGTGTGSFTVSMTGLTANTKYYVRAYAKNSAGVAYGNEVYFTTSQNVSAPTVTTSQVTNITQTTATGGGSVTSDGGATVTERGICWSTSHNPTTSGSHASSGTGTGSFSVNMTGLTPGTTYYVRAYAVNSQGTSYGSEVSFATQQAVTIPTVTNVQVTNITSTSATGSANVTNSGNATVTERGLCWSTSHNPTTSGSHAAASSGGTGTFSVNLTSLSPGTTYYVRAYATNSAGTAYSAEVSFTTLANLPTVTTSQVMNITSTSATGGGNVTNNGGGTVTERGVCWSISHNPTTSGSHAAASSGGNGSFTVPITGLTAGTTYYVRAYAINSAGTAYGTEVSFTAAANLPTVTTSQVTNITQTTATGGGNVTASGGATVTERGICWSTSHNPTTNSSHASSGSGTGSYTANLTGLTNNTTYYVRAYATNSAGTAYGTEVSFTTAQIPTYTISVSANPTNGGTVTGGGTYQQGQSCTVHATASSSYTFLNWTEGGSVVSSQANYTFTVNSSRTLVANFTLQVTLPTVTTSQVTDITSTSATGGGNVTNNGGGTVTERGVCWSTSHNPTTSGSHAAASSGGTGSFTAPITGLTAGTTYYVRAYAINSAGTAYGTEVSFTAAANLPTVTTSQVTNITQTTATSGGNVTASGGATVTERGICWGTSHNPTTSNSHVNSGTGTGTYTVNMTSLTANTTYYVRAYAINSAGTAYGSEVSFTTSDLPSYTIAVSANPSSGGTVSGGGTYQQGQSCTVTASANTGYTFLKWTENGSQVSTNANYTFTVNGNRTLVAQFQAQSYMISVSANPSNGGMVSGGGSYNYGQSCTVVASANSGYEFTNWTEGGSVVSSSANYTFNVTGSRTLVANFTVQSYTISVSANPSNGGSVSGGGSYNYDQSCMVSATAASGYTFTNWTEGGSVVSSNANYTFTVTGSRTLVANFTAQNYTISVSANPSSGGSVSGGGNFNYGQGCTVSATAATGYNFTNWTEGGSVVSTNVSYQFTVTANRTLVANFTAQPQAPQGAINGLFTINANGDQVFFSKGNLQYIGSASTPYWKFADNQWDYFGDNGQLDGDQNVDRDLFGWGTSGWDNGNIFYQPWDTDSSSGSSYGPPGPYDLMGSYANSDWGVYNTIYIGSTATTGWRTMTKNEWSYVFFTRSTISGVHYAKAKLNNVNGIILLPDNWIASTNLNNCNQNDASFESNVISSSQWGILENDGAVFLPCAGERLYSIFAAGSIGYYWTSSNWGSDLALAYKVYFSDSAVNVSGANQGRQKGDAVRLVFPAE